MGQGDRSPEEDQKKPRCVPFFGEADDARGSFAVGREHGRKFCALVGVGQDVRLVGQYPAAKRRQTAAGAYPRPLGLSGGGGRFYRN